MGFPLLFPGHNISYSKYFKETPSLLFPMTYKRHMSCLKLMKITIVTSLKLEK